MKLVLTLLCSTFLALGVFAQLENNPMPSKKDWKKVDLSKRSADHLMFQFGYHGWFQTPDSIRTKGFSNSFNAYFFFDFPFKANPRLSVGLGVGVGTDNIYFEETRIDLKNPVGVQFNRDSVNELKKYKLATGFFEIPLELRFSTNPANMNKGFKAALGGKIGLGYDAHTKAKIERDADGNTSYVTKEKDRKHFNSPRLVATARVGWGNFTVFGTYQFNAMFKEGRGPAVRPYTIGLAFSGL